jgi:hypothetical protein
MVLGTDELRLGLKMLVYANASTKKWKPKRGDFGGRAS